MSFVRKLVLKAVGFTYGFYVLGLFIYNSLADGSFFSKPTQQERRALAEQRKKLWDLNGKPYGLNHRFFETRNGKKLHYVVNRTEATAGQGLVIFIHGFPDSWAMWRRQLSSEQLNRASTLVALDLPNYGGSDDFASPSHEDMLEAVTELIVDLREQFAGKGPVIICTHDWGSIWGLRLAAEAHQLADRFIICSIMNPALTRSNAQQRVQSASRMLKEYVHHPGNFRLLRNAQNTLAPVFGQLQRSGYIFAFNLPHVLVSYAGRLGNQWFLRYTHRLSEGGPKAKLSPERAAEAMAVSVGPGPEQSTTGPNGLSYPPSALKRSSDGGWMSKTQLYRDDLATKKWTKSLETLVALNAIESTGSSSGPTKRRRSVSTVAFDEGPRGSLKAPATIVMGLKDPAFEMTLTLEGMRDYLVRGSQLVVLEDASHWLPLEQTGSQLLERLITWSVQGEKGKVQEVVNSLPTPDRIKVKIDV